MYLQMGVRSETLRGSGEASNSRPAEEKARTRDRRTLPFLFRRELRGERRQRKEKTKENSGLSLWTRSAVGDFGDWQANLFLSPLNDKRKRKTLQGDDKEEDTKNENG